ncbi:GLPGLI family protein [Flavobacterium sp. SM15]|uniref:GLPGLI family protein n=1 Tax=Flavobacterium sp. SM15 TaxID=2908005 RepID=UPI001EDB23DD|nr:GLPGLI family protein [Flavobacterium sp. SM15]MCG2610601.1 GLPGLI family protein [Flavobacterium sp. SM15]
MKIIISLSMLLSVPFCFAQKNTTQTNGFKITYLKSSNGTQLENQDPIAVFSTETESLITTEKFLSGKAEFPFEQTFIDHSKKRLVQLTRLGEQTSVATTDSTSIQKQSFEFTEETKTILGYKCKKATTTVNSNHIDLWFTNDLKIKGAPTVLGQNLGLVLEMNRNNNFLITAVKIEKQRNLSPKKMLTDASKGKNESVDLLTYRDKVWKSRFTTIPVFENEIINFSDASKSNDSILRFANGTVIVRKIKLPVIKKGSQIFIDVTEQSNGDAYDRTGSVFIIPTDKSISFLDGLKNGIKTLPTYENGNTKKYQGVVQTQNYSPLLELMRFFTPFGIKQYNHLQLKGKTWEESVPYRQDISELQSALDNKEVWIGAFIGNYDKGGHKISANITLHTEEGAKSGNNVLIPLFNTTNVMEMAGQDYATMFDSDNGLLVEFVLEKDLKNARLRYISTGHGGWENGDEYLQKKNTILLDNQQVYTFIPWRQDCATYRLYNPASGNFNNGLSSSDYSRSNWCPGTVTNPTLIDLGDLKAGKHSIRIKIPQGKPEGNSFSAWNVSGVLLGSE